MKVLKRGAEAVVYRKTQDGRRLMVKERVKKRYRLGVIDERLRSARTRQELKLMREARGHGVHTPTVVSSDDKSCVIVMEDLGGETVKDALERRFSEKVCTEIGKGIGKLHSAGIVHGDLTTSNMVLSGGKVHFIDFGLGHFSKKVEDMAVDLAVLYEAARATHSRVYRRFRKSVERGYASSNASHRAVLERLEKLEKRGRYVQRRD